MSRSHPTRLVVLVTGIPGSGKSTLAQSLCRLCQVPLVSLDGLKEELYERSGGRLEGVSLRLAAEKRLAEVLGAMTGWVVVDIWIQPDRDNERVQDLLARNGAEVREIVCRVPPEVAVERYRGRPRHPPHKPADAETLQRIRDLATRVQPLGLGSVVEIDTTEPVTRDTLTALLD